MKAVEFEGVNVRYAENQEEYQTLPAYVNPNNGEATFCFELDEQEIAQVKKDGKIYLGVLTFFEKLQPIRMSVLKPQELK